MSTLFCYSNKVTYLVDGDGVVRWNQLEALISVWDYLSPFEQAEIHVDTYLKS